MAIYHLTAKIISRSSGRSSVAAACYRSGDIITNEWDGVIHDYSRKGWIEHQEIMLPDHMPDRFKDRSTLWNSVEMAEKSGNAQLAREIEIALPIELSLEQNRELVRNYIKENFTSKGMAADFAIHNPPVTDEDGKPLDVQGNPTHDTEQMTFRNPHVHILLTMRPMDAQGKWLPKSQKCYVCKRDRRERSFPASKMEKAELDGWKKQYQYQVGNRKLWMTAEEAAEMDFKQLGTDPKSIKEVTPLIADWNNKSSLLTWRESWAAMCNEALKAHHIDQQIDHRSYVDQGINKVGGIHLGMAAYHAEKSGFHTERGDFNRQIEEDNRFLDRFRQQVEQLEKKQAEYLKQTAARLAVLRSQYIATAYQQIMLSSQAASGQNQMQAQATSAAAYARMSGQLLQAMESLIESGKNRKNQLAALNPLQWKQRKVLEDEIADTEAQIQRTKERLKELDIIRKSVLACPSMDKAVLAGKQEQVRKLRELNEKTWEEFFALVNANKENLRELKDIIREKQSDYDSYTRDRIKENYGELFDRKLFEKAQNQAPVLPEMESDGAKNNLSRRR